MTAAEEELTAFTLSSCVPVMVTSAVAPGSSELGFMALITAGSVSCTNCWISCCVAGRVTGALPAATTAAMPAVQGTRPGTPGSLLPTITVPESAQEGGGADGGVDAEDGPDHSSDGSGSLDLETPTLLGDGRDFHAHAAVADFDGGLLRLGVVLDDAQFRLRAHGQDGLVEQGDAGAASLVGAHQVVPDDVIALLGGG